MRLTVAVVLACTSAAFGQVSRGGVVSSRAAGGVVFANPSGYGNVAFPGTGRPQAQVPFATSLGAVVAGRQIPLRNGAAGGRGRSAVGYGYPVFVGGGYGGYYDQGGYPPQETAPITIVNNIPAPVAPTVIINQNFGPPAPAAPDEDAPSETTHIFQPQPRPELSAAAETAAPPPHYFLIAYKDHSVYSALAYWLEDKTMHYVTPQQTHNQASVDLIDLDFTKKLNQR